MPGPRNQMFTLLAIGLPWVFVCTLGCNRLPDPRKAFDHAQQTLLSGDLPRAQAEAHTGYLRFSGQNQEWAWKFRLLEAEILLDQGSSRDALSLIDGALPSQLANGELAVKQKTLRGSAYVLLDRFEDADQNLRQAEELCSTLQSPIAGEIARARGVMEWRKNDPDGAKSSFRHSLQLARQQNDALLEMTDLLNLGVVAKQEEHYDESIDWLNDAYRKAHIPGDQYVMDAALGNLAGAYHKMGNFDRALTMYQEAEKTARDLGAVYHRILWLNGIGSVYSELNQFSLAADYYRQSLTLAQGNENAQQIIDALIELAFVSVQTGQLDKAQQYSERASQLAHTRKDHPSELYLLLVEAQVAAARGNQKEAEKVFREVANDPQSDPSLRWEAQNDLARLYEQQLQLAAAEKQYQAALATIEQSRSSLQHEEFKLPFMANAAHLYDDYIHFLLAQGKDSQALQLADYSRARTLAEGLGVTQAKSAAAPDALNAAQIARQAHATILFYWVGQERSYLWAITPKGTTRYPLPKAAEIDAAVEGYRRALLVGWQDVLQTQNQDGIRLYDMLVKPASKLIAPDSRVILITDGSLDKLNFETLLVPDPKPHYWIEDVTLVSASSLRVLSASRTPARHSSARLLLIGDAVTSRDYAPLPNAALELQNVAKHFPGTTEQIYTRDRATPAAYTATDPGQFSFIHFVAHATASKLTPLDSAIVLSPASAEPDSFKLYARDITQHPLHADLVTISSCNGAGTQAYSGEGLVGLSWAFLRAGAHNVIGALWEVSDASTARLMDQLYSELQRGQPPEAALRQAKLSLLHSNEVFRKPFYWAPFQLYTGR
jgi:CHAT domain-containing protein/Tfp pilus assembly protein PilF